MFYKTFFLVLISSFDWLENVQNNGSLIVWNLLSVIFMSIWLMMFKNFFTLFKILSAETFFPLQPFVSSIIASRPLETVNQIDSKKKKVIWIFMCLERCSMYLFRCRCRKDIKEIVLAPQYQGFVSQANYVHCCDNVVMMIQTLIIFILFCILKSFDNFDF